MSDRAPTPTLRELEARWENCKSRSEYPALIEDLLTALRAAEPEPPRLPSDDAYTFPCGCDIARTENGGFRTVYCERHHAQFVEYYRVQDGPAVSPVVGAASRDEPRPPVDANCANCGAPYDVLMRAYGTMAFPAECPACKQRVTWIVSRAAGR